jgi:hypothetical protein
VPSRCPRRRIDMATKITKRLVDAVEPAGEEVWIADGKLAGLFLRVFRTGIKTFVVQYRHGRGRAAPKRVYTIGRYPILTVDQARTKRGAYWPRFDLAATRRARGQSSAKQQLLLNSRKIGSSASRIRVSSAQSRNTVVFSKRTFSHTSEIDDRPTLPSPTWRASERLCPTKASSRTGRWPHSRPSIAGPSGMGSFQKPTIPQAPSAWPAEENKAASGI